MFKIIENFLFNDLFSQLALRQNRFLKNSKQAKYNLLLLHFQSVYSVLKFGLPKFAIIATMQRILLKEIQTISVQLNYQFLPHSPYFLHQILAQKPN